MKLISKQRLQISSTSSSTVIRWWVLSMADLAFMFILVLGFIYGFASYRKANEILGLKVLSFSEEAALVYWGVWVLLLLHILFNRTALLRISSENLIYKRRLIFGTSGKIKTKEISRIEVKTTTDSMAESPADGRDITTCRLFIYSSTQKVIRIKGLSEADADIIQKTINQYR